MNDDGPYDSYPGTSTKKNDKSEKVAHVLLENWARVVGP